MKTPLQNRMAVVSLFLLFAASAPAQDGNKQVITDQVEGHIFRAKQVATTPERLKQIQAPEGFTITPFASGLNKPRMLEVTPEGYVYATDRDKGLVTLLIDKNNDGKADVMKVVAQRDNMHGITYHDGKLYLITVTQVFTAGIKKDGTLDSLQLIITNLPDGGQHANRTLHFGPDDKLYISIGSTCNSCDEPNEENATIMQFNADGTGRHIFARGLRNTIGFRFHPQTKQLWGFDQGIDWLGDSAQREEINLIKENQKYGWPYVYEDGKYDLHASPPNLTYRQYAFQTTYPELMYTAHSAAMDWLFYTGRQWPKEYQNDAIVTMHGSWNREHPSGYRLVRVHFEKGKPTEITDFITGFYNDSDSSMFARVCGLVQLKDGSVLFADDANGYIYRIAYDRQPMIAKRED